MNPNTSMVQFSNSGGSNTRRWITASTSTYAVSAPGSVRIGSRGLSGGISGRDSKSSKPEASGSRERLPPISGLAVRRKRALAEGAGKRGLSSRLFCLRCRALVESARGRFIVTNVFISALIHQL